MKSTTLDTYRSFYGWMLLFGLILLGVFLLWQYDLLAALLENDRTRLSAIIVLLFFLTSLFLGWRAWRLAREAGIAEQLHRQLAEGVALQPDVKGWAAEHLGLLQQQAEHPHRGFAEPLQARLVEQVHGGHNSGWFISDMLLRLGLIGTVIGFVMMLGSVYALQEEGVHALKQLLTSMGGGMQVALYTTLSGLGSAILTSIQCHWLDRCADRLVSRIIETGAILTSIRQA